MLKALCKLSVFNTIKLNQCNDDFKYGIQKISFLPFTYLGLAYKNIDRVSINHSHGNVV